VGSGDGTEKRGEKIGEEKTANGGQGVGQAGNQEGEEIYETEITIEELINYLFDDLNLPDIDKKRIAEQESIRSYKNLGYQRKGIPQDLPRSVPLLKR